MARQISVVATVVLTVSALAAPAVRAQSEPDTFSPEQIAYACSPLPVTGAAPANTPRITGSQNTEARSLFGSRDLLVISGGAAAGIQLGQRYFVKHQMTYGAGTLVPTQMPHTTGWIRVVAVNGTTAIATVEFACDGIIAGDYLAPFVLPLVPAETDRNDTSGTPDFSAALGHVLFGNEVHDTGVAGDFMMLDRGARQGMSPGVRLAIYRDLHVGGVPLVAIGDAIVVSTADTMSVMRIVATRDVIQGGDYVVPKH
jgi:hypothetical protein